MSYTKNNFKSGDVLLATQLNKMDEQISVNENDLAALKEKTESIELTISPIQKILTNSFVNSSGAVVDASNLYDLSCFSVSGRTEIDSISVPSAPVVYAFFDQEPKLGNVSHNSSRVVVEGAKETKKVEIPEGCNWIAIRTATGQKAELVSYTYSEKETNKRIDSYADADKKINERIDFLEKTRNQNEIEFELGSYTYIANKLPNANNTAAERFRTHGFYKFLKNEAISTLHSNVQMNVYICGSDGVLKTFSDWTQSYTFNENTYAYIVFKANSVSDFTGKVELYSYFFHRFFADDSVWKNKIWYSFGTSMSDINPDGLAGNNGTLGKWPLVIDELSGMTRTNKAIGSGGICPSASHGGNVKQNILNCPYDVDLVTLECGLNDWGSVPLGEIGDKSDDTFIGNFTQCIEHLTYNTRAKIVLITMTGATYEDRGNLTRRSPLYKNSNNKYYRDYLDAEIKICQMYGIEVIDAQANALNDGEKNTLTIKDTIHFTDLGGQIYGRYVWNKLKNISPSVNL